MRKKLIVAFALALPTMVTAQPINQNLQTLAINLANVGQCGAAVHTALTANDERLAEMISRSCDAQSRAAALGEGDLITDSRATTGIEYTPPHPSDPDLRVAAVNKLATGQRYNRATHHAHRRTHKGAVGRP